MKSSKSVGNSPTVVPILPLRDMVVFPNVLIPLFLKGSRVVKLAESVVGGDNLVGLFYQKAHSRLSLVREEISVIGTLARIQQVVHLENGGVKAIADGMCRVRLVRQIQTEPYFMGEVEFVEEESESHELLDTLIHSVAALFKITLSLGRPMSDHWAAMIERADDPGKLADLISVYLPLKADVKQSLLEIEDPLARLKKVFLYLQTDVQALHPKLQTAGDSLQGPLAARRQKETDLRQQMRSMQRDLGPHDGPQTCELQEFQEKIRTSGMPDDAVEVATRELQRLERIPAHSPEYVVSRTYLEVLTSLPWNTATTDNLDIGSAQKILDEDHYDLVTVKNRILEFLAVRKLKQDNKGPILCLVGPPGVGKTSLGRSIARALGRKFIRMSLGGIRDEAEIRGHRRTYIGAMPGKIIQEIRRGGTKNPVFMLDEIDKIGQDFRGDPACALLEVLDPEQNHAFGDHYLDIPFDLSGVMFVATANQLDFMPPALRDRMEVIRIPGYTDEEKEKIAELFLIPKTIRENGIQDYPVRFTSDALRFIIASYTREAGVRNLERKIGSVCRKIARGITQEEPLHEVISPETVEELIGPPKFYFDLAGEEDKTGVATGLAWTENGGDIIFIEVAGFKGQKELTMTGCLGEVMQESARAALSYMRNSCDIYGIDETRLSQTDLHIHVPAGAIPKDGPSAGITIAVALASFFTGIPVRRDVAMTGEVTLRGRVLPIGGVKEKLLAARRAGVREVILPKKNEPNLVDLPDYVKEEMTIHFITDIGEAIRIALAHEPRSRDADLFDEQPILPLFHTQQPEYVLEAGVEV
ncbi:MAG TPA: endopeptidase La [Desulfomonilaceae bacterium]|nr:endopeptidase La [Desulfomonilaceae bacterium]